MAPLVQQAASLPLQTNCPCGQDAHAGITPKVDRATAPRSPRAKCPKTLRRGIGLAKLHEMSSNKLPIVFSFSVVTSSWASANIASGPTITSLAITRLLRPRTLPSSRKSRAYWITSISSERHSEMFHPTATPLSIAARKYHRLVLFRRYPR